MNKYLAIIALSCAYFAIAQAGGDRGGATYPSLPNAHFRPSAGLLNYNPNEHKQSESAKTKPAKKHWWSRSGGSSGGGRSGGSDGGSYAAMAAISSSSDSGSGGSYDRRRRGVDEITADDDVESQLSLNPSNDEEVASLDGKTAAFSDFCISSRDYVIGDLRSAGNSMASRLFSLFFSGAESLGLQAVKIQREAAERLANQIRNPAAPIADAEAGNEVDSIIADGQRSIQANAGITSQPRNLLQGVVSALAATRNAVTSHVLTVLNQLKAGAQDLATFTGALRDACDRVAEYDQELMRRFEAARSELAAHDAAIGNIQLEEVGCVTLRRIIRLDGICKFAMAATNPLIKAITYKPLNQ